MISTSFYLVVAKKVYVITTWLLEKLNKESFLSKSALSNIKESQKIDGWIAMDSIK